MEIQGDSMGFESSFFPWYFKRLRLVNRKEKKPKNLEICGAKKNLYLFFYIYIIMAHKPWSKKSNKLKCPRS